jgi:hypothetical protein
MGRNLCSFVSETPRWKFVLSSLIQQTIMELMMANPWKNRCKEGGEEEEEM